MIWEKLSITLPDQFAEMGKNPLSPIFNDKNGLLPIEIRGYDVGITGTIYLTSDDFGLTWMYDDSYDQLNVHEGFAGNIH